MDTNETDFEHDVEESMRMFERARVGEIPPIQPCRPGNLLVILDGSSQDATSTRLADRLRGELNAALVLIDGREDVDTNELGERIAESLQAGTLPKTSGQSFEQVLQAIEQSQCDLVIIPSPFGRDLESVGADSTGSVIDVLLARSPVPILVVRDTFDLQSHPGTFPHVLLVLTTVDDAYAPAAAWSVGMASPGGLVELFFVLEHDVVEGVQQLLHALHPDEEISEEQLESILDRSHGRLTLALKKCAHAQGLRFQHSVHREGNAPLPELTGGAAHPLIVLPIDRKDHLSQSQVQDRIRHSHHPLLVVPVHHPGD